ncbi:MAG TPA: cytochrome c peroxidase [Verrucomicrobiae bacterium]|nr:cytochrome c peroxidase [Verrucomicrobiae bacterium]
MRNIIKSIQLQIPALLLTASLTGAEEPSAQGSSDDGRIERGKELFRQEFPKVHGNGRSCATCHVPEEAFQLTPQHVEARYQALQERRKKNPDADDPLFRSIDANDGDQDFTNLRQHALSRIILELPKDANGQKLVWPVDDPDAAFVSVWRSTPTILNTAFTAPYQMDGRQPTLQAQALGALVNHAEITTAPKPRLLDDVAAFEENKFSSHAVRHLAEALASGQTPPPTDPPLNALEQQGKALFEHHCVACHGGPTQTVQAGFLPPFLDIRISRPLPPFAADLPFAPSPLTPRNWAFRVEGQAEPTIMASTDPGRALHTGSLLDLNAFDIPTLYGIAKTAPYFHDNSAETLEKVMRHYQLEFEGVRRVIPDFLEWPLRPDLILDEQIAPIVAYLKKI